MKKLKTLILLAFIGLSLFANAQKMVKYKEIKPLLDAGKYDEALPFLKTFYSQYLDENGNWSSKAILVQMENMYDASENIATIYYNKAKSTSSIIYADSALYWFDIMDRYRHPNIQSIAQKRKTLNDLIAKENDNLQKEVDKKNKDVKLKDYADKIVYNELHDILLNYEMNYYKLKKINKNKSDSLYKILSYQIQTLNINNVYIDTSNITMLSYEESKISNIYLKKNIQNYWGCPRIRNYSSTFDTIFTYTDGIPIPISDSSKLNLRLFDVFKKNTSIIEENIKIEKQLIENKELAEFQKNSKKYSTKNLCPNCPIEATKIYINNMILDMKNGKTEKNAKKSDIEDIQDVLTLNKFHVCYFSEIRASVIADNISGALFAFQLIKANGKWEVFGFDTGEGCSCRDMKAEYNVPQGICRSCYLDAVNSTFPNVGYNK